VDKSDESDVHLSQLKKNWLLYSICPVLCSLILFSCSMLFLGPWFWFWFFGFVQFVLHISQRRAGSCSGGVLMACRLLVGTISRKTSDSTDKFNGQNLLDIAITNALELLRGQNFET
jgi:hypothetical protein